MHDLRLAHKLNLPLAMGFQMSTKNCIRTPAWRRSKRATLNFAPAPHKKHQTRPWESESHAVRLASACRALPSKLWPSLIRQGDEVGRSRTILSSAPGWRSNTGHGKFTYWLPVAISSATIAAFVSLEAWRRGRQSSLRGGAEVAGTGLRGSRPSPRRGHAHTPWPRR